MGHLDDLGCHLVPGWVPKSVSKSCFGVTLSCWKEDENRRSKNKTPKNIKIVSILLFSKRKEQLVFRMVLVAKKMFSGCLVTKNETKTTNPTNHQILPHGSNRLARQSVRRLLRLWSLLDLDSHLSRLYPQNGGGGFIDVRQRRDTAAPPISGPAMVWLFMPVVP